MGEITAKVQFERAGNSPDAWQSVVDSLLFASQVLTERYDAPDSNSSVVPTQNSNRTRLGGVELMLRGMAVECLLKALWLKQGNLLVKAGKFEPVSGAGGHDLPQLAHAVSLCPTELEIDLLKRLSHFIEYGGRYPIPKASDKLRLTKNPRGGRAVATTWLTPSDNQLFDKLVFRLVTLLA